MNIQDFISDFEDQFEKIDKGSISPETEFKSVKGWDSLTAMLVIDMVNEKYGKTLSADSIRKCKTVKDIFDEINSI